MASRPSPAALRVAGLIALAALGCATPRDTYTPADLRAELLHRVPELRAGPDPETLVVPFEVPEADAARARDLLARSFDTRDGVERLIDSLSDPDGFGLRYEWATTRTAKETLERGRGNCFSLASVLVGLARAAGLRAFYVEVTLDEPRWRNDGDVAVYADHIAAVVMARGVRLTVDFNGQLARARGVREIGDLEALAHYYNNRGYERIYTSTRDASPVPWEPVRRDFEVATRIHPGLARAWNNLGVASLRLGDLAGAERAYERAVEIEDLQSAHMNLGMLNLRKGDVDRAIVHLLAAQRLDPRNPQLGELLGAAAEAILRLKGPAGG